jgi:hypothetical protein
MDILVWTVERQIYRYTSAVNKESVFSIMSKMTSIHFSNKAVETDE